MKRFPSIMATANLVLALSWLPGGKDIFLGGSEVCDHGGVIGLSALGAGINPKMVGRLDTNMANTHLVDVLAGIVDISSTRIKIEKAV